MRQDLTVGMRRNAYSSSRECFGCIHAGVSDSQGLHRAVHVHTGRPPVRVYPRALPALSQMEVSTLKLLCEVDGEVVEVNAECVQRSAVLVANSQGLSARNGPVPVPHARRHVEAWAWQALPASSGIQDVLAVCKVSSQRACAHAGQRRTHVSTCACSASFTRRHPGTLF